MPDIWEEALKEAYTAAPSSAVVLPTIELRHETFRLEDNTPFAIRLVRDHGTLLEEGDPDIYGHLLRLEDDAPLNGGQFVIFQACMFDLTLPEQTDSQVSGMELVLDNVTKLVSEHMDKAVTKRSTMAMIYREYLADDFSFVQLKIGNLSIKSVTSNVFRVTATAQFNDLVNKKFPRKVYRPEDFPGLQQ